MSKFPLPPNFFRQPQLNVHEAEHLCRLANNVSIDFIRHAVLENGPIRWTMTSDEGNYKIYEGDDPMAPSDVVTSCGVAEIHATIEEVATLFRTETSTEHKLFTRRFAKDCLDSVKIYSVASPTPEEPRNLVGVTWIALESPAPVVVRSRDFCCLEVQRDFSLNGKRGWLRALKSIEVPCCPDFRVALGLVRAEIYRVGHLVIETDQPGYLRVIQLNQGDMKLHVPAWIVASGVKRRCRAVGDIDTYICEARLEQTGFASITAMVPTNTRVRCFLCIKKFGTFQPKKSCRKCGEVVCTSCSQSWNIMHHGTLQKMRICLACERSAHPMNIARSSCDYRGVSERSSNESENLSTRDTDIHHNYILDMPGNHRSKKSPYKSRDSSSYNLQIRPVDSKSPSSDTKKDVVLLGNRHKSRGKIPVPMLELEDPIKRDDDTRSYVGPILLGSEVMSLNEFATLRPKDDSHKLRSLYNKMRVIYNEIAKLDPLHDAEIIAQLHEELQLVVTSSS